MQHLSKLPLHGDHLFAHVERDFGAFQIDAHFGNQEMGDSDPVQLISRVVFKSASDRRLNDALPLETRDKVTVDAADFHDLGNAKEFPCHRFAPDHKCTSLRTSSS